VPYRRIDTRIVKVQHLSSSQVVPFDGVSVPHRQCMIPWRLAVQRPAARGRKVTPETKVEMLFQHFLAPPSRNGIVNHLEVRPTKA